MSQNVNTKTKANVVAVEYPSRKKDGLFNNLN